MMHLGLRLMATLWALTASTAVIADAPSSSVEIAATYWYEPDVAYHRAGGKDLTLDIYAPKTNIFAPPEAKTPTPTIIYFHGGGWMKGNKGWGTVIAHPFIAKGWSVVTVGYRLGDVAPAPAAVEDARCAVRWVIQNATKYGFDTDRLVLMGRSAGGHLALTAGMLPVSAGLDYACPETAKNAAGPYRVDAALPEIKVAAIVNWFGIPDVAQLIDGPSAKTYAVAWLGSQENRLDIAKKVSPINYVRPGLPPILTIHGDKDSIVPYKQALKLHKKLDQAGVANHLYTIKGRGHLFDFTPEDVTAAYQEIDEFLQQNGLP